MSDQPPNSMSPGSMLDGRYRLEVLLSEHDGARFWRATDTVLARSVAVHVVASTDPRAAAVLDAARTSARVTDPHFLRVLDCDDVDGITWVINEWGEGTSLDIMLAQGPLPPMRAAWLTREVAEAIAAAHAQGLHHGRLNPEAVLVTDSGAVKIIGFIVNAAFERTASVAAGTTATSSYGVLSDREADVIDLAGILYAALTVRWPGVAPSALAPAPREGLRPLRPRQVRAGVPRTLDAICDRVLHKEASQHVLPVETAHDIAAALSDYVGDPAAAAPVDVPSMHDDPEAPAAETGLTEVVPAVEPEVPVIPPVPASMLPPLPTPATEAEVPETPAEAAAEVPVVAPADEPEPEPLSEPAPDPSVDPDATMAAPPPFSPSGIELIEPEEWVPAPPPPPFEAPVSRPLFAEQERRVPAGAPLTPADGDDQGSGVWPFGDYEPSHQYVEEAPRRRTWLRVLLALLLIAGLAGGAYAVYREQEGNDPTTPRTTPGPTATTPAPATGAPITISAAGDFDPEGDPPAENPELVPRAIDGNPATAWRTSTYRQAALGGIKSGVGVVLDLGTQQEVGSIEVQLIGAPTELEFFATAPGANDAPLELADARRLGGLTADGTTALFRTDAGTRTRYVMIWLTNLPKAGDGFQGQIAEITVRS